MLGADWTVKRIADGTMYYPPEGKDFGAIGIRERVRPLRSVKDLFAAQVRRMQHLLADIRQEPPEQIVTSEGEYAAICRFAARAKREGTPVECMLGLVFGDDSYDEIDAYCTSEKEFPRFRMTVREVIFGHRLALGTDRGRRFYYDPPRGWQGIRRNLLTEWYPPEFPRHRAKISVAPVFPQRSTPGMLDSQLIAFGRMVGFTPSKQVQPERVTSTYGLSGVQATIEGSFGTVLGFDGKPDRYPTQVTTAALQDERYTYLLRLETTDDHPEDRAIFAEVVRSARPIPAEASRESDLFVAWSKADR